MGRSIFVFGSVFLALIIAISCVNGNDQCPNTIVKLLPCKCFLMGKDDISGHCCKCVKGLMKMVTFDNDLKLQSICECLKKETLAIGVIEERAKQIPQLCNINLSIPIDPNVDCKNWAFPPEGFIKINTDGSFMPNTGLAGFGGVARDDKGRWLGGFYGRLSTRATSSLTAELWAIHGGLILAKNYNFKNVIIETDSSEALKWLTVTRNVSESHPDRAVIEECKSLLSKLGITLIYTLRQGNNCADHLAKLGWMQQEDLVIIQHPPHSMQRLLRADMAHVAYPRCPKHVYPNEE